MADFCRSPVRQATVTWRRRFPNRHSAFGVRECGLSVGFFQHIACSRRRQRPFFTVWPAFCLDCDLLAGGNNSQSLSTKRSYVKGTIALRTTQAPDSDQRFTAVSINRTYIQSGVRTEFGATPPDELTCLSRCRRTSSGLLMRPDI